MSSSLRVSTGQDLDRTTAAAILELAERVGTADGSNPLSEQVLDRLSHGGRGEAIDICLWDDSELIGYGVLDPSVANLADRGELTVDSTRDNCVVAAETIIDRMLLESRGTLHLWAHGAHPCADRAIKSRRFAETRRLLRMRRSLLEQLPIARLPDNVRVRAFDVTRDRMTWLALNARAFVELPDQGSWTAADLQSRTDQRWFDPEGFLVAHKVAGGDDEGPMIGFHWTKIHPGSPSGPEPTGEVFILGVDPAYRGSGLGRSLAILGMQYLASRGLSEVFLYVDSTNSGATRTYERLGFEVFDCDIEYTHSPTSSRDADSDSNSADRTVRETSVSGKLTP